MHEVVLHKKKGIAYRHLFGEQNFKKRERINSWLFVVQTMGHKITKQKMKYRHLDGRKEKVSIRDFSDPDMMATRHSSFRQTKLNRIHIYILFH